MKTLVIYDSAFGNTKKIAEAVAKALSGEAKLVANFQESDLKNIELLIVGSPINGWMPLPSIMAFLNSFGSDELKGLKATAFDTRVKLFIHGDAKEKIAKNLERVGANIIAKPEAFYVEGKDGPLFDGEIERALVWAKSIAI